MRRREFITLFSGAVVVASRVARAEQSPNLPIIGVLWHAGSQEEEGEYCVSLLQGFRDLGYIEGQNITFVHRFANEQYERFRILAAELIALKVDILVAITRPAISAAQAATRTIPIVMAIGPDPVGNKFAESLARPGGNITGLANMTLDITGKRLELLKEMVPDMRRAALLINPSDAFVAQRALAQVREAATRLQVTVEPFEAHQPSDLDHAFDQLAEADMQGVFSINDPMFHNERVHIAALALTRKLPILLQNSLGARGGALMSYGPDSNVMFRRVGYYVDRILKGEKPGEIPIEQPTKFELVINLNTAKALGLTIPSTLLARADDVIE
jgi:ABC-type uncharacterized transport system substrate-binding protein